MIGSGRQGATKSLGREVSFMALTNSPSEFSLEGEWMILKSNSEEDGSPNGL